MEIAGGPTEVGAVSASPATPVTSENTVNGDTAWTPSTVHRGLAGGSVSVGGAKTNLYEAALRKMVARPEASRTMGLVFAADMLASVKVLSLMVVPDSYVKRR
jgi:hypothetical protein